MQASSDERAVGSVFRPAVASPSIEQSHAFVAELRTHLEKRLPTLSGAITVALQAGRVEEISISCVGKHMPSLDEWESFRQFLRVWVVDRTPSDWYGSVTLRAAHGRAALLVISRSFR